MIILYYYYYLFYTKILSDNQPHSTVVFCLSLMEGFIINGFLKSFSILIFCYNISKWPMIGVSVAIIITNYLYYYKSGRMLVIVERKPKLFGSNTSLLVPNLRLPVEEDKVIIKKGFIWLAKRDNTSK